MTKLLLFGGTSEGRELAEKRQRAGDEVVVCVTSQYGKALLPEGLTVYDHPMDIDEMMRVARRHAIEKIVDATHPFAAAATENIRACAKALSLSYERITRPGDERSDFSPYVTWVQSARDAAALLANEMGAILLTTGSKTLKTYTEKIDAERLYARVLPAVRSLELCAEAGLLPGHIIAMQGPFSEKLNGALYDQFAIRHVVSKDSGGAGGVREKVMPALMRDMNVIVIKRPEGES